MDMVERDPGLADIHTFIWNENKSLLIRGKSGTGREIGRAHV